MKKCKSEGCDKITPEMVKYLANLSSELLTNIFNKYCNTGKVPEDWKIGLIIPTFKNIPETAQITKASHYSA